MTKNKTNNNHNTIEKETLVSEKELNNLIQSLLETNKPAEKPKNKFYLLLFLAILLIFAIATFEDFVHQNPDGTYVLKSERKRKMDADIEKLEGAEQYVLSANSSGYYSCYSCLYTDSIFLFTGEVWKYGITITPSTRYSYSFLENNKLLYLVQFRGLIHECLQEEKRKIRDYPLLPENIHRTLRLARPPGNSIDR